MSLSSTPLFWSKEAVKLMINSVEPTALQTMSNDSGKVFLSTFSTSVMKRYATPVLK